MKCLLLKGFKSVTLLGEEPKHGSGARVAGRENGGRRERTAPPCKKNRESRGLPAFLILARVEISYFFRALTSSALIVYALVMTTGSTGTSLYTSTLFVGTWRIFSTVSIPEITFPNTQ